MEGVKGQDRRGSRRPEQPRREWLLGCSWGLLLFRVLIFEFPSGSRGVQTHEGPPVAVAKTAHQGCIALPRVSRLAGSFDHCRKADRVDPHAPPAARRRAVDAVHLVQHGLDARSAELIAEIINADFLVFRMKAADGFDDALHGIAVAEGLPAGEGGKDDSTAA